MSDERPTVLFIHGLWIHAESWRPWIDFFADRGYQSIAPGWPGDAETVEATRDHPEAMADHGIKDIVDHYAEIIETTLAAPPIVIGHSVGGLIAQLLLDQGHASAAVAIDSAPVRGVMPLPLSTLKSAWPALKNPRNRHRTVELSKDEFRYAFGNAISESESDELHARWAIPGPARPLFEEATANLATHPPNEIHPKTAHRGPLLLITGQRDHVVPPNVTESNRKRYGDSHDVTDMICITDRGHSLTIDHRWRDVAEASLDWLDRSLAQQ